MKKILPICALFLLVGLVGRAAASVIAVDANTYDVSYQFNLGGFPSNGGDVQDLFIFEWNSEGDFNVDFAYTLAGHTSTTISHTINFNPTSAFAIGYGLAIPNVGDEKDHIYTFTDTGFAYNAVGSKWSDIFPGSTPESRVSHSAMVALLADAASGDAPALVRLTDFVKYEASDAAFDPTGGSTAIEWSIAQVPEPATITLFGLGLASLGWARRKRL
jgi:PEP-CTERM motif